MASAALGRRKLTLWITDCSFDSSFDAMKERASAPIVKG